MYSRAEPGTFKGITYRSQLEVTCAKFFDLLDIDFEYENPLKLSEPDPDGYVPTRDFEIHPDFWLPNLKTWLEIKSSVREAESEEPRVKRIAQNTGYPCALIDGKPRYSTKNKNGYYRFKRFHLFQPTGTKKKKLWKIKSQQVTLSELLKCSEATIKSALKALNNLEKHSISYISNRKLKKNHSRIDTKGTVIEGNPKHVLLPEVGPGEHQSWYYKSRESKK